VFVTSSLVFDPQAKNPTFLLHSDGQDMSRKVSILKQLAHSHSGARLASA